VEDAIIYLLQRAYSHLEEAGSVVRVTFFDLTSAFNTIKPALLGTKLLDMQVDAQLVAWITNYLTGRPQHVRHSEQHGSTSGDSPVSLPVHTLHLRLQIQITVLPPAEVFG